MNASVLNRWCFSPLHMFNSHKWHLDHLASNSGLSDCISTSWPTRGCTWVKGPELHTNTCFLTSFVSFLPAQSHQHSLPHGTSSKENKASERTTFGPHSPEAFIGFYITMLLNGEERERQKTFSLFREKPVSVFRKTPVPHNSFNSPAAMLAYKLHMERQPTEQEKSTITWHCNRIHKTHLKGYKRALLIGHCRG